MINDRSNECVDVVSVYDWESFRVGDDHYLLSAEHASQLATTTVSGSDAVSTSSSVIYRWQGVEKFVPVHRLDTPPATDWETFTTDSGQVYLVCANGVAGVSQLFRVKMV